jgi:hypothetical protein
MQTGIYHGLICCETDWTADINCVCLSCLVPDISEPLTEKYTTDPNYAYWLIQFNNTSLISILILYYVPIFLTETWNSMVKSWTIGARGSVVVKALCYKPEGGGFDTRWGDFFKVTALGPGVYSAPNRNEYRKHKK